MLRAISAYLQVEHGGEMVEWVVIVVILAVITTLVFGPDGVLKSTLETGLNKVSDLITNLPTTT